MPSPRSDLATIPHATIQVTNLATGETETREPGSWIGLHGITALYLDGPTVVVELGTWRWRFTCATRDEAERRMHQIAIRASR